VGLLCLVGHQIVGWRTSPFLPDKFHLETDLQKELGTQKIQRLAILTMAVICGSEVNSDPDVLLVKSQGFPNSFCLNRHLSTCNFGNETANPIFPKAATITI